MSIKSIELRYTDARSDKVYRASIEAQGSGYVVNFAYGRYGSALTSGTKTAKPVTLAKAEEAYKKLYEEKTGKGYKIVGAGDGIPVVSDKIDTGLRPQLLNMISESDAEHYITDDEWGCQEKYDGKHLLFKRAKNGTFTAANKKGQQIPVPKEVAAELESEAGPWVLDGELIGTKFYAFDVLELGLDPRLKVDPDLRGHPYGGRYMKLSQAFGDYSGSTNFSVVPLYQGTKDKRAFVAKMKKEGREGVVFKRLSARFTEGRPNSGGDMLKLKFWSSISCWVLSQHPTKRSVDVGLFDGNDGPIINMGSVTIPPNYDIPEHGQLVEVKYLYVVGKRGSLYQPIYLGVRDDVSASECTIEKQHIKYKKTEE